MTIPESFKRFRKEFGLSQQKAAEMLEVTQPAFAVYESARNISPTADTLIKMSKVFNVSIDYLLGMSDNPQVNNSPVEKSNDVATNAEKENEISLLKNRITELETKMARLEKIINF